MSAPTCTAAVNSNGSQVDLTFDQSVTGVAAADYLGNDGNARPFKSVSGSGASWSLVLKNGFIATGSTVTLNYTGTATINGSSQAMVGFSTKSVTNSSAITAHAKTYTDVDIKTFFHFSGRTFSASSSTPNQAAVNAFDCANYSMDQWLDVAQSMRAKAVILTTKHDFGFSIWPTAQGNFNIGTTAWNTRTPGIDVVGDFSTKAKARGLKVGLYYNAYDPWYINVRAGSNGTYSQGGYAAYVSAHIDELLAYNPDYLWFDSVEYRAEIGYTNIDWTTLIAHIASSAPNVVILNNAGAGSQNTLAHTQVCVAERQGFSSQPATSNVIPYEYTETCSGDGNWTIPPATGALLTAAEVGSKVVDLYNNRRCSYLFNLMPDNTGRITSAQVTLAAQIGALLHPLNGTRAPGIPARGSRRR